jgi:hypothetical protein
LDCYSPQIENGCERLCGVRGVEGHAFRLREQPLRAKTGVSRSRVTVAEILACNARTADPYRGNTGVRISQQPPRASHQLPHSPARHRRDRSGMRRIYAHADHLRIETRQRGADRQPGNRPARAERADDRRWRRHLAIGNLPLQLESSADESNVAERTRSTRRKVHRVG